MEDLKIDDEAQKILKKIFHDRLYLKKVEFDDKTNTKNL